MGLSRKRPSPLRSFETKAMPANVAHVGHVFTRDHNAFNVTPTAVLNINRDSMARFGASLHVSGIDEATLQQTVDAHKNRGGYRWSREEAGLEEAFIYLMTGARDNFARDAA